MLAADYPFLNIFWTMLIFFAWVCWITILFMVLADNFRRPDHSGWAKAGWTVLRDLPAAGRRARLHRHAAAHVREGPKP